MHVRPLHDRIVVRRIEEGEQRIGGIIIPDTAKEKALQGIVIAVGNGKATDDGTRVPIDVKRGDRILFGKYAGQEIKLDGKDYLIVKEEEVLAVIDGEIAKKVVVKDRIERNQVKQTVKRTIEKNRKQVKRQTKKRKTKKH